MLHAVQAGKTLMYACWAPDALLCWRSSTHEPRCRPRASLGLCKQHFSRYCCSGAKYALLVAAAFLCSGAVRSPGSALLPVPRSTEHCFEFASEQNNGMHTQFQVRLPVVCKQLLCMSLCAAMCRKIMECKCKPCSRCPAPSAPSSRSPYLLLSANASTVYH